MATYQVGPVAVTTNTYTSTPYNKEVKTNFVRIRYVSSATVGNRQLKIELYDSAGNMVWDIAAGAVQAASLTVDYDIMPNGVRETSVIAGSIQCPYPTNISMLPGWYFKVYDSANISATDTMTINVQHSEVGIS